MPSEQLNFECDVCQKQFSEKSKLSRHRSAHFKTKNYQCSICHKLFAQKHHLDRHVTVHTGEKPHQCNVCEKSFSHREYLARHLTIHSDEKPYSCERCGKSFPSNDKCKRHMKRCNVDETAMIQEESQRSETIDELTDQFDDNLVDDSNYELINQRETVVEDTKTAETNVYDSDYVMISLDDINQHSLVPNIL